MWKDMEALPARVQNNGVVYIVICSVTTIVLTEKQEKMNQLSREVEELREELKVETKMSKAKTKEIEQLTSQKEGSQYSYQYIPHWLYFVATAKVLKEETEQLTREKEKNEEMQQLTEQGELTVLLVVYMSIFMFYYLQF